MIFNSDNAFQIAELKRINNILRDNEIFARRTVKIPARLFTKKLPGVHASSSHRVSSEGNNSSTSLESLTDSLNDVSVLSCVPLVGVPDRKLEDVICVPSTEFHVRDATNACGTNRTVLQDNPAENFDVECSSSPLIPQEDSSLHKNEKSMYSCNGADWGLSWLPLLICSLLLGCAGPILYIIYLPEDSNKHT